MWQETAVLRDFEPAYDRSGSDSVIPVMSDARPLFPRKRTSIRDLAMSQKCQQRSLDHVGAIASSRGAATTLPHRHRYQVLRFIPSEKRVLAISARGVAALHLRR
jgi:hypothetical protein